MNKAFYSKLAAVNMKKNSQTYIPYILSCIGTISMYYIMYTLSKSKGLDNILGSKQLKIILSLSMIVMAVFSVIFLFYTNSFLIKKRKKEFGIYNILGMEKKHISKVMFLETIYTAIISLVFGIGSGILLSKLFYLFLIKLLNCKKAGLQLTFEFSLPALYATLILFIAIFLLTYLNTLRQIHLSNPIELLRGGQIGEKEPKTKWILTTIGAICLGTGYYISLTTKSPLDAIPLFIFAVILVIIGTYCLFTAGSIALLKMLRKNKKYYYKTNHFTSISGMIYRMKQNAVGLGNICILSTAVLVMMSTTVSLYVGMNDLIRNRYPRNIVLQINNISEKQASNIDSLITLEANKYNVKIKNLLHYRYMPFTLMQESNQFKGEPNTKLYSASGLANVFCMPLSYYNKMTGNNTLLNKNEVLLEAIHGEIKEDTINFGKLTFNIKERISDMEAANSQLSMIVNSFYLIVPDEKTIQDICLEFSNNILDINKLSYYYGFDTDSNSNAQIELTHALNNMINNKGVDGYAEGSEDSKESFYSLYGGLLFIGIFLGILFIMATVLIIYYKQISEGYDDKERFAIMQKVGMSHAEVKRTIVSQVLTVFFLPLAAAFIHTAFAFPIITKILAVMNLTNYTLFIYGSLGTALLFTLLYTLVYSMTAKAYYKIVH